jgi:hypothetical protein
MKKLKKFISIWICFILLLPIISSASSEKQKLTTNVSSYSEFDIVELINSINESRVMYFFQNLLSFGIRFTGTPNCTQAGDWIYSEFEQMGLDVEFHDWKIKNFESRNVVATIPGADPSSNAIFIIC